MSLCREINLPVRDYDLDATLGCGQAFGWEKDERGWTGVVTGRWVRLRATGQGIRAEFTKGVESISWLSEYLQIGVDLREVIATFPKGDVHLAKAVERCFGLRLVRQDPWECLASFILSSTKQIVQIRQIVRNLSEKYGTRIRIPNGESPRHAFPTARQISKLTESELRSCKMGFRAPYLLAAAQRCESGELKLGALGGLGISAAREELMKLDGVGEKIADCVLLFAYGFPTAFPVDVWVRRVLVDFYFRGKNVKEDRLRRFIEEHFGPNAGYAQQYLFHHIRQQSAKPSLSRTSPSKLL